MNQFDELEIKIPSMSPFGDGLTKSLDLLEEYFTTYLQDSSEGPSRKYYKLTTKGRKYLYELIDEWNEFSNGVNQLMKEGVNHDER